MVTFDQIAPVITGLGGAGFYAFIQFLITRRDNKKDKLDQLLTNLSTMDTKVDDGFTDVNDKISDLKVQVKQDIDDLRDDMNASDQATRDSLEVTKATTARVRILRASDEIRHKMKHSKEWFDQLNDDITFYETYCVNHPKFVNNKARHAITNINDVYAKALKDDDFL